MVAYRYGGEGDRSKDRIISVGVSWKVVVGGLLFKATIGFEPRGVGNLVGTIPIEISPPGVRIFIKIVGVNDDGLQRSNPQNTGEFDDFYAPTRGGYNWTHNWRLGKYQSWVTDTNREVTASMQTRSLAGKSFEIRSTIEPRVLVGDDHAIGFGACGSNRTFGSYYLAISEIHYHPAEPGDGLEYLELQNISDQESIHLDGLSFTAGITFTFPEGTTLAPGERGEPDCFRGRLWPGLAGCW